MTLLINASATIVAGPTASRFPFPGNRIFPVQPLITILAIRNGGHGSLSRSSQGHAKASRLANVRSETRSALG